jgi:hypothetical protein
MTATIRTVSWQGAYYRGARAPGTPPLPPPAAASSSFQVGFYRDVNGHPGTSVALYEVTFTPAEVSEQFAFESVSPAGGCAREVPPATYYDYTAVLPMPFPLTAGTRYWLLVLADTRGTGIPWGWRAGTRDNNYSVYQVGGQGDLLRTFSTDLAFSLSSQ